MTENSKKVTKICMTIVFVALYFVFLVYRFSLMPMDSDYGNLLLEAQDIINGNFFRDGWHLTGVSFLTTDLLLFMLGVLIFGVSFRAYVFAVSLMYFLLVLTGYWIINIKSNIDLFDKLLYIILVAVPGYGVTYMSRAHTVSVVYCLITIGLLEKYNNKCSKVIATTLVALAMMGDALGIVFIILPYSIVYFLKWIRDGKLKKYTPKILFIIIGIVLGFILNKLYFLIGNCEENSFFQLHSFVETHEISEKIALLKRIILTLFNADYSIEKVLSWDTIFIFVGISIIITSIVAMIIQVVLFVRGKKHDTIALTLTTGVIIISTICLMTTIFTDIMRGRYFGTIVVVLSIIIIRSDFFIRISSWNNIRTRSVVFVVCVIYLVGCFRVTGFSSKVQELAYKEQSEVVQILKDEGLTNGYSDYWNASSVTAYSGDTIKVRTLYNLQNQLTPYNWFCKEEWYNHEATFVLEDKTPPYEKLGLKDVDAILGKPIKVIDTGRYYIKEYDKDISNLIKVDW